MNNNDIYRKTALGIEEIKDQSTGVLPREARTLLVLVDGKKTYQRYIDTLNNSRIFADSGGIAPFFDMLLDLQYIELVGESDLSEKPLPTPKPVQPNIANERQAIVPRATEDGLPSSQSAEPNNRAEFDAEFNSSTREQSSDKLSSIGSFFKREQTKVSYATLKSDLATYIEKNAPTQDAWGYLLSLEQCENDAQLLILIERIQNSTSGNLSQGMDKFSNAIKRKL